MPNFHIRISRDYATVKPWVETESCDKIVVFEHEADDEVTRTHCHIWAIGIGKSDTLKNHIKKLIGNVDKTDWYFTEKNKKKEVWTDDVITYMSKGTLTPMYVKGYTDAEIEDFKGKWVVPKSPLKMVDGKLVIEREVGDIKKKTKRQLIEDMKSLYLDNMETEEIIKLIRKVLIQNNEVIGMYKVMDYYDALLMYSDKRRFIDMVVQKINSRVRV